MPSSAEEKQNGLKASDNRTTRALSFPKSVLQGLLSELPLGINEKPGVAADLQPQRFHSH